VGLFRYWTLPNVPLFLMAAPVLWLLLKSSVTVLRSCFQPPLRGRPVPQPSTTADLRNSSSVSYRFPELAFPQLVLAVAAITNFHVQIVNRIASGYPTWYTMIAEWIVDGNQPSSDFSPRRQSQWIFRGIVMYAMVQGMLFANFLPPA
jgi:phosphatidylinositol glycan class V